MKRQNAWKIFRLPSPSELGMTDSEYDALPMRDFQKIGDPTPTWEDWEERVKKDYPIRYFFAEGMIPWIKRMYRRYVEDPIYWIKCHILPKYKYHLLDLRQPKENGEYRYGWLDADHQMEYALFNILNRFVEKEMPNWYCPSEEDIQTDPHLTHQRNLWMEAKNIHYWWNVERKRQDKKHAELVSKWYEARHINAADSHKLWDQMNKAEQEMEDKKDEMIARLLKIRRSLWT